MDKKISKNKSGIVVSDKMDKTVVVIVESIKEHPVYKKKFTMSKKFKADDQANQYKIGDKVEIASVRPLSRDKKYIVVKKVN